MGHQFSKNYQNYSNQIYNEDDISVAQNCQSEEDSRLQGLIPITSPPDSFPYQYPSQLYLTPQTSYEIDEEINKEEEPLHHHNHNHNHNHSHNHNHLFEQQSTQSESQSIHFKHRSESTLQNFNDYHSSNSTLDNEEEYNRLRLHQLQHQPLTKQDDPFNSFSPLLSLPLEILYNIIEYVYIENDIASINSNLEKFANKIPLLSKKFHQLSLCFMYKYTIFNRPHSFDKFLNNLKINPIIGKYVEFMDFQQFTSIGLGRTGRMNQEIQMVTSRTIFEALCLTPNLIEFLASENIQDDLDVNVLNYLFNNLNNLKALDLCGASSESFAFAFENLEIMIPQLSITKLSLHDCSNLSQEVLLKIITKLFNTKRLDLNHTSINSSILLKLPISCKITHLSLARCSKLTTKDLINFLVNHPSVNQGSLEWLNLQIDSNVVSPLTDVYLLYTLRHLNAPNLKYLNIGGMPINYKILLTIKNKFLNLISLNISHARNISLEELNDFMNENSNIKFLDLSGIKCLSKNLVSFLKKNFNSNLEAIEFDYKNLYDYTSKGDYLTVQPIISSSATLNVYDSKHHQQPQYWKFYDNEGRRAWIYKTDEDLSKKKKNLSNLTFYDLETGNKIVNIIRKPNFLKYASRKLTDIRSPIDLRKLQSFLSTIKESKNPKVTFGHNSSVPNKFNSIKQFTFGQSNPTYYLTTDVGTFVLRRKPSPNSKLISKSAHAVEREFFILNSINIINDESRETNPVPIPKVHLLCEDESIIGYVFYIMDYINGIQIKNPSLPGISQSDASTYYDSIIRMFASIHSLDVEKLISLLPEQHFPQFQNIEKLKNTSYFERQIKTLTSISNLQNKHVNEIPNFDTITKWLLKNKPKDPTKLTLIHGDLKIDNILFDPITKQVIGILDWELCTIGNPLFDLSNFFQPFELPCKLNELLYKSNPNSMGLGNKESKKFLFQQLREYSKLIKWDNNDPKNNPMDLWPIGHVFGLLRLCVISQGIAMRVKLGNASSSSAKSYSNMYPYLSELAMDKIKEWKSQKQESKF
ncbi:unnamed protein product [Candida verbasci]|uniref:Aminoglycoside phosphotransferase domain-containing protein n=1 Tax=Candida verbasci TaxID=1227364 RepID=A0A9W4TS64_9ASCO|nr:unnamed protein product [Candida verbasci]